MINGKALFGQVPTLETPRLKLRQITLEDTNLLYDTLYNVPDIIKYDTIKISTAKGNINYGYVKSMDAKINEWNMGFQRHRIIVWGIELKATRQLIGIRFCELYFWGIAILECKLAKAYWGNGYMSEASQAVINFLMHNGIIQIYTVVNNSNIRSIKMDVKLGFSIMTERENVFISDGASQEDLMFIRSQANSMLNSNHTLFCLPQVNYYAFYHYDNAVLAILNHDFDKARKECNAAINNDSNFKPALDLLYRL